MQIFDHFLSRPLTRPVTHQYLSRDGMRYSETETVLSEHPVCITVNDCKRIQLVCLPEFLVELTLGHLLTEGFISSADEISSLTVSENGEEIQVVLNNTVQNRPLSAVTPVDWRAEWVFALADRFAQGMPLHSKTFATHSCFLAKGDSILFQCEDIGRHNALDKAVGFLLRSGLSPESCLLYSSGRMPQDMVRKAIRAGIPTIAAKGSPTAEAIELARRYQLTLICAARQDRLKQFTGPEPLPSSPPQPARTFSSSIPLLALSGYSGSGKTTFLERLIPVLKSGGLRVAVIKHDGHAFEIDHEGTDSYRFAKAGADAVLLCSAEKTAFVEQQGSSLEAAVSRIQGVDLILIEGWKHASVPRIGICRKANGKGLPSPPEEYMAVITDDETLAGTVPVPCFSPEAISSVADWIQGNLLRSCPLRQSHRYILPREMIL